MDKRTFYVLGFRDEKGHEGYFERYHTALYSQPTPKGFAKSLRRTRDKANRLKNYVRFQKGEFFIKKVSVVDEGIVQ